MKVVCVSTAKVEFHYETNGKVETSSLRTGYRGGIQLRAIKYEYFQPTFFNFPTGLFMKVVCVSTAKVQFHFETYGKGKTSSLRTGYRGGIQLRAIK